MNLSISLLLVYQLAREDIKEKYLSAKWLSVFIAGGLIRCFICRVDLLNLCLCLLPGFVLLLLARITREQIGYGDGIAILGMGLWTNIRFVLIAMEAAFIFSFIYGLQRKLCYGKNEEIPFLPFLLLGMVVTIAVS